MGMHKHARTAIATLLIISLLIFLYSPSAARKIYYAAAALSIILLIIEREKPRKDDLILAAVITVFCTYRILHTLHLNEDNTISLTESRYIDSAKRLLLSIPLIFTFSRHTASTKAVGYIKNAAVGSLFLGMLIILTERIEGNQRPGGELLATFYAYCATAIYVLYIKINHKEYTKKNIISYIAATTLTFTSLLITQTRSALIIFLVILFFEIYKIATSKKIFFTAIIAISIAASMAIKQRIIELINEVSLYANGTNNLSSVGDRFHMWAFAIESGIKKPSTGIGYEGRLSLADSLIKNNKLPEHVNIFIPNHLHNEVLDEFSTRGMIGIILLLTLYLSPFLQKSKNKTLINLFTLYATLGITDCLLQDRATTIILAILIPLSVWTTIEKNENTSHC